MTQFSILLATRDRPDLFGQALESVMAQTSADLEIVIVDDGSAEHHAAAYEEVLAPARAALGDRLQHHRLLRRPNGHGQSYSLNVAAEHAGGHYLAILDDDDVWTDPAHLARAAGSIARAPDADLYMAHQRAFAAGEPVEDRLWLWQLARSVDLDHADEYGTRKVTLAKLVSLDGFCHLNCLIIRRDLWAAVGGMDEAIRWECDRDLFMRLIDTATGDLLHNPAVVSRHNIPDPARSVNMTTALTPLAKRLQQLRVVDKMILFGRNPAIRALGRRHRGWTLQKLAGELAGNGDLAQAGYFARAALAGNISPVLAGQAALYTLKAMARKSDAR